MAIIQIPQAQRCCVRMLRPLFPWVLPQDVGMGRLALAGHGVGHVVIMGE